MPQESFTFFWNGPFSQWHPSAFVVGGVSFTHAEQFMMYAKALVFADHKVADQILKAKTPREQKALGRTIKAYDDRVWSLFREGVVFNGSYAKYSQNSELQTTLLATPPEAMGRSSPVNHRKTPARMGPIAATP